MPLQHFCLFFVSWALAPLTLKASWLNSWLPFLPDNWTPSCMQACNHHAESVRLHDFLPTGNSFLLGFSSGSFGDQFQFLLCGLQVNASWKQLLQGVSNTTLSPISSPPKDWKFFTVDMRGIKCWSCYLWFHKVLQTSNAGICWNDGRLIRLRNPVGNTRKTVWISL